MDNKDLPILLITGCIKPCKEQPYLKLSESEIRFEQYIASIEYYIQKSPFKEIVYCDSSNIQYPIESKLVESAKDKGKKFEWLCFAGNVEKIKIRGKGYGEGEIIKYALSKSTLLKHAEYFVKITGRLQIKNIEKIVIKMKAHRMYFNSDIYRSMGIDTRIYCCNVMFYKKYLINLYENCSDSEMEMALEDLLYDYIHNNNVPVYCFPCFPLFSGISGGTGRIYDEENRVKIFLFSVLCKLGVFNSIYDVVSKIYRKVKIRKGYKGYRER